MSTVPRLLRAVVVSCLGGLALLSARPAIAIAVAPSGVPALTLDISSRTRLLVLAPHPDDEVLGAAGLIARVQASGGAVRVMVLTSGDAFPEALEATEGVNRPKPSDYRSFGLIRERETREAMALLKVPASHVSFLGFPDEGMCELASTYLFDKRRAFESPYTDRVSPPPTEQIIRGARYRGIDVRLELERVITSFAPTVIVLPQAADEHPDHCSTHIFAREALNAVRDSRTSSARVLHYLIHYGQWPRLDGSSAEPLEPPPSAGGEGRWVSLTLTPQETALKVRAIEQYRSQMHVIAPFMRSFAHPNELFLEGEPREPVTCWCNGRNVAPDPAPRRGRRRP